MRAMPDSSLCCVVIPLAAAAASLLRALLMNITEGSLLGTFFTDACRLLYATA